MQGLKCYIPINLNFLFLCEDVLIERRVFKGKRILKMYSVSKMKVQINKEEGNNDRNYQQGIHCRNVKWTSHILCAFTFYLYLFTKVAWVSLYYSTKLTITGLILISNSRSI